MTCRSPAPPSSQAVPLEKRFSTWFFEGTAEPVGPHARTKVTTDWLRDQWLITIGLLLLLGAIFLRGFQEAIGLAVVIVIAYLALNTVVLIVAAREIWRHPEVLTYWRASLFTQHGNPAMMAAMAVIRFPKLALGLSGFETGVAVMPLVRGDPEDTEDNPAGRIRNTKKLLSAAALIMSFFLRSIRASRT